jgi:hypothetical protein
MENKTKFRQCPKCNGYIPESWTRHEKCGWIEEEAKPIVEKLAVPYKEPISRSQSTMVLAYCKDLIVAGKVDIKDLEAIYKRMVALI